MPYQRLRVAPKPMAEKPVPMQANLLYVVFEVGFDAILIEFLLIFMQWLECRKRSVGR